MLYPIEHNQSCGKRTQGNLSLGRFEESSCNEDYMLNWYVPHAVSTILMNLSHFHMVRKH